MDNDESTTYDKIADYFIGLSNETGGLITNLKLQKLVYYAQAWSLALNNKELFNDDFEAWVHGPVLRALYDKYKVLRWTPINKEVNFAAVQGSFSSEVQKLLAEVAETYFELDAYKLERLTHSEEPWIEARGSLADNEVCSNTISKDTMKRYYTNLVATAQNA